MSDTDIKIKFDCNGFSAPAYSCSKSGDNSGVYVQSTDYDALAEQNRALKLALCEISNMCVGNLTMSYSLDAQYIGELIYSVTGLTNPELNDALEQVK